MVEVSTSKGLKKVKELVEYYQLEEGFVYNYKTGQWYKYKRDTGEISKNPSFCDSIGYDLNDFLK